jgi:RimJ/RimL family protein N-acetyltransferase
VLRPFAPGDAEELHRLINDWEVCRTLSAVPFPYARDAADAWIAYSGGAIADGSAYHLAITGREGEQEILVGGVGLRMEPATRTAQLGYWVARRFWGHGVATEAGGRIARWALANLDIDRILASVATDNGASQAVLRRIGNPLMVPAQGQVIAPTDHGLPFESSRRSGVLGLFLAAALLAGEAVHRILQHGVPLLVQRLALLRPLFGSQLLVVGNRLELLF